MRFCIMIWQYNQRVVYEQYDSFKELQTVFEHWPWKHVDQDNCSCSFYITLPNNVMYQ